MIKLCWIETPVFLSFIKSHRTDEITTARIYRDPDTVIERDNDLVAEIEIYHPAGIIIDSNNWAGFLYQMIQLSAQSHIVYFTQVSETKRNAHKITTYSSFGYYYFHIETEKGPFVILKNRPEGTIRPQRLIGKVISLKSPVDHPIFFYNDEGIYIQTVDRQTDYMDKYTGYQLDFKSALSPQQVFQIYQKGIHNFKFTRDMFVYANGAKSESGMYQQIILQDIKGFQYFESLDGKVRFTLVKDPVMKLFEILLEIPSYRMEDAYFYRSYTSLFNLYVRTGNTDEGKLHIINKAIDLINQFSK